MPWMPPPTVIDLRRVPKKEPDLPPSPLYEDFSARYEPIRFVIQDRTFSIPPGAYYARYGGSLMDGSFYVEYSGPDTPWTRAEEVKL